MRMPSTIYLPGLFFFFPSRLFNIGYEINAPEALVTRCGCGQITASLGLNFSVVGMQLSFSNSKDWQLFEDQRPLPRPVYPQTGVMPSTICAPGKCLDDETLKLKL